MSQATSQPMPQPGWRQFTYHRRWSICLLLLALVWTLELFLVQAATLRPPQALGRAFPYYAPAIRLLLDGLFVTAIVSLLPRWLLALLSVAVAALHVTLLAYAAYFHAPLSILVAGSQWREGLEFSGGALAFIQPAALMLLLGALGVKLMLLALAGRNAVSSRVRRGIGLVALLGFAALFVLVAIFDPLDKIVTTRGIARLGIIRGYGGAWLAELLYLDDEELLRTAIAYRRQTSDRISAVEQAVEISGDLVVIQVESLGFEVIDYQLEGTPLTPFLNHLKDRSYFFRVRAYHRNGSADADFAVLMGGQPSPQVLNYNLPTFPYENTLPQALERHGYETTAMVGTAGSFFNQRPAYLKMGFDQATFREQLLEAHRLRPNYFGVRDSDLLPIARQWLDRPGKATRKNFLFIILTTSHWPYDMLLEQEKTIFPGAADEDQNYFNSMRYVDVALGQFIGSLPEGTTVLVYGDHTANVQYGSFASDRENDGSEVTEFVPGILHQVGVDLASQQRTRQLPIATDGSLTQVDLGMFLRHCVEQTPAADEHADGR